MSDLLEKEKRAIKLLRTVAKTTDGEIELSYSGGKDSDVCLALAQMAGIPYRAIYKNTTIDPPGTIAHCKEKGAEIIRPKKSFFELIVENGIPNRRRRFCCSKLKEYVILYRNVLGIRRAESTKRAKRYYEPEGCRSLHGVKQISYYPILDWSDTDVRSFVVSNDVKCHPLYYDDNGHFCVDKRLGCLGCPLMSQKKRVAEFVKYPKMLKLWVVNYQKYLDSHPDSKAFSFCKGKAYNGMFQELFTSTKEQYELLITGGMFPETAIDCKQFLQDYFKIEL